MAGQVGRIGGGVLADNLLRNGIDLNFKNTSTDTALLQLKVASNRIGIKTESPTADLEVVDTIGALGLEQDDYANIGRFTIQDSEINVAPGNLYLNANSHIVATSIATDDVKINNKVISTITDDADLELRPNGIGTLNIYANTNVTGSLHATGNITFGGNLTLGNDNADSVNFAADVNSDIVPDQSSVYNVGSPTKKWQNLYSNLLNGQRVEVDALTVSDTSLARRQGNIFYVSTLGNDSNVGDHQHGAFRTIEHALAVADASTAGPVTIYIFSGEYDELCPLVVPENTTITGEDIRNTIIRPNTSSQSEDIFQLNQNTLVENITIKDFYYNSIDNTGYAFRFAPNAILVDRSPYVKNITVITSNDGGIAGHGAWIDGSEVNSASTHASMLFHNATFITPEADCITMTNGVRVEWLNSFTYFANKGLYATQGTAGLAGLGAVFGAEIRSIGSANVYGTYGAVADGVDTLMYLISHNFAYIGSVTDVSNDRTLTLQDQETVELNSGRIYYTATDADGTFRVGDAFYVNFEDGSTSIDASSVDFSGISSIFINTGGSITYIDGARIDIGNIRFSGNTVTTVVGDLIWSPASGFIDTSNNPGFILPQGTTIQRISNQSDIRYNTETNLFEGFSSANVAFGGIYSDNRNTRVTAPTNNNIVFTANSIEAARISTGKINLNGLSNSNIYFNDSLVTTTVSNNNLELLPNGNGVVTIYDIILNNNVIENTAATNLQIAHTGQGYLKFDTTLGIVVPTGGDLDRPSTPEIGDTRWNVDRDYLEIYTADGWQRAAGSGEIVTEAAMNELLDLYTLVFG